MSREFELIDVDDYQNWTETTAVYPEDRGIEYCLFGLGDEVGELFGKYKKFIRGDDGDPEDHLTLPRERREAMIKELGDVCYYVARLASHFMVPMSEVLRMNVEKLEDRKARGKLKGDGDDR